MKINGIEIIPDDIHPAIIARIVDHAIKHHCVWWMEDDDNGARWQGPKILPTKIYAITADKDTGIMFRIVLADGRDELSSLGQASIELEQYFKD